MSSWINFGLFYASRNLPISSRLCSFLEYKFSKHCLDFFSFIGLGLFPLPFCHVGQGFVNLVNLYKVPTFCLSLFFGLNLIVLSPDLYYFCLLAWGLVWFVFLGD
jgi:hypothetical protein